MGNTQGSDARQVEVVHISSRPLPPLPPEEANGYYDLDSPPPYPPPPPPNDESKRISWKFIDSNLFKGNKKGSWVLSPNADYPVSKNESTHEIGSEHDLSNTLALSDNNVVAVSFNGSPDNKNNDQSWAVQNMQLVLNSEMSSDPKMKDSKAKHLHAKRGRYNLPDVVVDNNVSNDKDGDIIPTYKVGTIRVDYPESKMTPINTFNELDTSLSEGNYSKTATLEKSNSPGLEKSASGTDSFLSDHDTTMKDVLAHDLSDDSSTDGSVSPKRKNKFGGCFGDPKTKKLKTDGHSYSPTKQAEKQRKHSPKAQKKTPSKSKGTTSCFGRPKHSTSSVSSSISTESMQNQEASTTAPKINGHHEVVLDAKNPIEVPKIDLAFQTKDAPSIQVESSNLETNHLDGTIQINGEFDKPQLDNLNNMSNETSISMKEPTKSSGIDLQMPVDVRMEEHKLQQPEVHVDAINLPEPDISINLPRTNHGQDANLENLSAPQVSLELDLPNANLENLESAVHVPDQETDLDLSLQTNKDIAVDASIPTIEGVPKLVQIETPSQKVDVSPNLKNNSLKHKKPKHKGLSCFGKEPFSNKIDDKENDAYLPADKISVELPDASLNASIKTPDIDVKTEKPKAGAEIDASINADINVQGDIADKVELARQEVTEDELRVDVDVKSSSPQKKKTSLGSCFGKPKKKVDTNLPDTEVKPDGGLPKVEADASVTVTEPKKKTAALGSCFGKPKTPKAKVSLEAPETSRSVAIETPQIEVDTSKMDADGKLNMDIKDVELSQGEIGIECAAPNLQIDGEIDAPKLAIDISDISPQDPKMEFKLQGEGSLPQLINTANVDDEKDKLELNLVTAEAKIPNTSITAPETETPTIDIEVKAPVIKTEFYANEKTPNLITKTPKGKKGLPCFGKPSNPKTRDDTYLPSCEASVKVPNASLEADVQSPDVDVKSKKPKAKLTSCFGKSPKATVDASATKPTADVKLECDLPNPELDVSAEIPKVEVDVNSELPKVEADVRGPKSQKKKSSLTSCFKKSENSGSINPDLSIPKQQTTVSMSVPEAEIQANVKDPSINVPRLDVETPSLDAKTKKKSKNSAKLGSCFGKDKETSHSIESDVPSLNVKAEGEFHKLDADATAKIVKPKKKSSGLGSCFGRPKPPKAELDANIPEANVNASIEKPKLDLEVNAPNMEVDRDIDANVEVNVANIEMPKVEMTMEGEAPSLQIDANVMEPKFEIPESDLNVDVSKEEIDLKIELDTPEFESGTSMQKDLTDLDVDLKTTELKDLKASVNLPKLEKPDIEFDMEAPEVKGQLNANLGKPEIKTKKAKGKGLSCFGKSPKSKADADIYLPSEEISIKQPVASVETDVQSPNLDIKTAKPKSKLGSCFGKSTKSNISTSTDKLKSGGKLEGNIPSPEIEVSAEISTDTSVQSQLPKTDAEVKIPKPHKKKASLGSCFGKDRKNESIDTDLSIPKQESSISMSIPEANIQTHVEAPTVEVSGSDLEKPSSDLKMKSSSKSSAKLGLCFGSSSKKPKETISCEADLPRIQGENEDELPTLNANATGKVTKPKKKGSGLGSCFGKPKSPDVDVTLNMPEAKGNTSMEDPKLNLDISPPKVDIDNEYHAKLELDDAKIEIPQVELKMAGEAPNFKVDADAEIPKISTDVPSVDVGRDIDDQLSLKNTVPNLDIDLQTDETSIPEISVNLPKLDQAEIKSEANIPEIKGDLDVNLGTHDVKTKKPKGKGLSCFGKSSKTKTDGHSYLPSGEASVKLSDGSVDGDTNPRDIDVSKKKPKAKLSSCFGKSPKAAVDASTDKATADVTVSSDIPNTDLDVNGGKIPEGEITVQGQLPQVELEVNSPKPKKKKTPLGSCFGKSKKPKSIDAEISAAKNESSITMPTPESAIHTDIEVPKAEIKVEGELPDLKTDIPDKNIKTKKKIGGLGSCFGKPKSPKSELALEIPNAIDNIEIKTPKAELNVDVNSPKVDLTSEYNGELNIDDRKIEIPKVEMNIECKSPSLSIDNSAEANIEIPNLDAKLPKGELDAKIDGDFPKDDADICIQSRGPDSSIDIEDLKIQVPQATIDVPKIEKPDIKIETNIPEIEGKIDISSEEPVLKAKKTKGNGLSCFGKPKTTKTDGDIYRPSGEASIKLPDASFDANIKSPNSDEKSKKPKSKLTSCFGKSPEAKIDVSAEKSTPDVNIDEDQENHEFHASSPIQEEKLEVHGQLPKVDVDVKAPKPQKKKPSLGSCFGKPRKTTSINADLSGPKEISGPEADIQANVDGPNIEVPSANVEAPTLEVKSKKKSKNSAKLGLCFGKDKTPKTPFSSEVEVSDLNVKAESELPDLDGNTKAVKTKKKSGSLGSCFGKPKSPKPQVEGTIPEARGSVTIETPMLDADVNAPCMNVDDEFDANLNMEGGDIEIPKVDMKMEGKAPNLEIEIDNELAMPKVTIEAPNLQLELPQTESDIQIAGGLPEFSGDSSLQFDIPKANIEMENNTIKIPEVSLGVPESENPDIEVEAKIPAIEANLDANLKTPEHKVTKSKGKGLSCFGKSPKSRPDADIYLPTGEISAKQPVVPVKGDEQSLNPEIKSAKPKAKFGSCFGKSPKGNKHGKADMPETDVKLEANISSPDVDMKTEIPGNISIQSHRTDGEVESQTPGSHKKKTPFGSCFGKRKSNSSIDISASNDPSMQILAPETNVQAGVECPEIEVSSKVPSTDVTTKSLPKNSSKLGSCFGKKEKEKELISPDANLSGAKIKAQGELPNLDVDATAKTTKPKKKSSSLGSCFGKPKPPKTEVSVNITESSENMSVEKPKLDVDINAPSVDFNGELNAKLKVEADEIEIPKVDMKLEGKDPSLQISGDIDVAKISIDAPNLNIELPKTDLDLQTEADLPEFKKDSRQTSVPDLCVNLETPQVNVTHLETPDIEIQNEIPKIEGNLDVNMKEPKSKGFSCFGKSTKTKKNDDAYRPSGELSGKHEGASVEVDIKSPSVDGKTKKPKAKLGSCFGKSPNTKINAAADIPKTEAKFETDIVHPEVEISPEIPGQINVESLPPNVELQGKASSPQKKKLSLGSCFGKSTKSEPVDTDISVPRKKASIQVSVPETDVQVNVEGPSIEVSSPDSVKPSFKSETKNSSKTSAKLGSCFGKNKKPKVSITTETNVPSSTMNPEIKLSNIDVDGTGKVTGPKSKSMGLGSCFGKPKPSKTKLVLDIPESKEEISIQDPKLEVDISAPKIDVDDEYNAKLELDDRNIEIPQIEMKLETQSPNLQIDNEMKVNEITLNIPALDVEIPETDLNVKIDRDLAKLDEHSSVPALDVDASIPDINYPQVSVNVPKLEKPVLEGGIDIPKMEGKLEGNIETAEIKATKPKSKGLSCLGKSPKTKTGGDVYLQKGDISAPRTDVSIQTNEKSQNIDVKTQKPKTKLGSCFGKSPKTEMEASADMQQTDVKLDKHLPKAEVKLGEDTSGGVSIQTRMPESDIKISAPASEKKKASLGSCFGKSKKNKPLNADLATPETSVAISAPKAELKANVEDPVIEVPSIEIEATSSEVKTEKPSKNSAKLGSCFGKNKKSKLSNSVEAELPSLDVKVEGELCDLDVDATTKDVKPKKKSAGLGACFGKPKTPKVKKTLEMPEASGNVSIKNPELKVVTKAPNADIDGEFDAKLDIDAGTIELPKVDINIEREIPVLQIDGNIETPDINVPEPNLDIETPERKIDLKVEVDTPELASTSDMQNRFSNVDIEIETVEVKDLEASINLPKLKEPSIEIDTNRPKIEGELDVSLEKPELETKSKFKGLNCFGKSSKAKANDDLRFPSGEISVKQPIVSAEAETPSTSVKTNVKSKTKFGSCFGKSPKANINASAEVPIAEEKLEKKIGNVEIEKTTEELEVNVPGSQKNKASIGSCFGKPKKTESVDVDSSIPKAEGSVAISVPKADIEANVEVPSINIDTQNSDEKNEKRSKNSSKLTSCFGKDKKRKATHTAEADEHGLNKTTNVQLPDLDADASAKIAQPKKKSAGLGSCFKKPKSPKAEVTVDIPETRENTEIGKPKLDVDINGASVDLDGEFDAKLDMDAGKVEIPRVKLEMEGEAPDLQFDGDMERPELKIKTPSLSGEMHDNELSVKTEGDIPKVEEQEKPIIELEPKDTKYEQGFNASLEVPDLKVKKPKSKELSCFGKSPKTKADDDIYLPQGEISVKGSDDSLEANNKPSNVDKKSKKQKTNLGACFGKSPTTKISGSGDAKKNEMKLEGDITIPKIEASAEIPDGINVEVPQPKGEIEAKTASPQKKKASLTSCFGKNEKNESINAKISVPEESAVTMSHPEASVHTEVDGPNIKESAIPIEASSSDNKNKKSSKNSATLGSCFGKSKSPKVSHSNETNESGLKVEAEADLPNLDDESSKIKVAKPKKTTSGLSSCFGNPKSSKAEAGFDIPKADRNASMEKPNLKVEGELSCDLENNSSKVDMPNVEMKAEGKAPSLQMNKNISDLEIEMKVPKIEAELETDVEVQKPKSKGLSCFGKSPKTKVDSDAYLPGSEVSAKEHDADIKAKKSKSKNRSMKITESDHKAPKKPSVWSSCLGKGQGKNDSRSSLSSVSSNESAKGPKLEWEIGNTSANVEEKPWPELEVCVSTAEGLEITTENQVNPQDIVYESPVGVNFTPDGKLDNSLPTVSCDLPAEDEIVLSKEPSCHSEFPAFANLRHDNELPSDINTTSDGSIGLQISDLLNSSPVNLPDIIETNLPRPLSAKLDLLEGEIPSDCANSSNDDPNHVSYVKITETKISSEPSFSTEISNPNLEFRPEVPTRWYRKESNEDLQYEPPKDDSNTILNADNSSQPNINISIDTDPQSSALDSDKSVVNTDKVVKTFIFESDSNCDNPEALLKEFLKDTESEFFSFGPDSTESTTTVTTTRTITESRDNQPPVTIDHSQTVTLEGPQVDIEFPDAKNS